MTQTSTNITQEYCQKTRYNYVRSSVFFASNCSPLLCYRSVTTALTAQIPTETLSQTHWVCFTQRQAFPTSELGTMIRIFWLRGLVWIRLRISILVCRLMLIVDGILSSWWTRLTMASQGLRRTIGFAKTTRQRVNETTSSAAATCGLVDYWATAKPSLSPLDFCL